MNRRYLLCSLVACAAVAAGCATAVLPGAKQADTPPRLVLYQNALAWDNPAAFGPVPEALAEAGAKVCGGLNTGEVQFKAIGYHAAAQGADGRVLPGGGFFCVKK